MIVAEKRVIDGRKLKTRLARPHTVSLKISEHKRDQFDRLRIEFPHLSYTEIFERALDDFEAAQKKRERRS